MSLSPELLRGRAQKASRTRWHGEGAETTPEMAQLEATMIDRTIAELKASWQHATQEQKDSLRRLWQGA